MKKIFLFLLFLCVSICAQAQDVNSKFYFRNKFGGFIPKLYRNHANNIQYGYIDTRGDSVGTFNKDITIESLANNITIIPGSKEKNNVTIFPSKDQNVVTLLIKYKNKVVKEQKFEVLAPPNPNDFLDIYLTANNPKNKPIDLTKPIPMVKSIYIMYKKDNDFMKLFLYHILYFDFSFSFKSNKKEQYGNGFHIDLSNYTLRSGLGDAITINIEGGRWIEGRGCPEYLPIMKKFVLKLK